MTNNNETEMVPFLSDVSGSNSNSNQNDDSENDHHQHEHDDERTLTTRNNHRQRRGVGMVPPPPAPAAATAAATAFETRKMIMTTSNNNKSSLHHSKFMLLVTLLIGIIILLITWNYKTTTSSITEDELIQSTPFCNRKTGICGEQSDIPSPRTIYSVWNLEQYNKWWYANTKLNQTAKEYNIKRIQQQKQQKSQSSESLSSSSSSTLLSIPIIFLGDSITESWLGTRMGLPSDKYKDIPDVLNEKFGNASKPIPVITRKSIYISDNDSSSSTSSTTVTMNITFDPLILGISGDQTQHLLYRIQNGQQFVSSYEYVSNPNSIFVIMIGHYFN